MVAGVGLLGASAGAEGAAQVGAVFKLALIVAIAGLAIVGLAAAKLNEPFRTTALGLTAGFGYGLLSIAARVLNGFSPLELARDPAAYAVAAAGIISFMFYATALESGSVTVATAAVVLAETIPPAVIGVVFLGDQTRPGLSVVAWAGFFLAVASAVMLARFGEAHHTEDVAMSRRGGPPGGKCRAGRRRPVILVARGPAAFQCPIGHRPTGTPTPREPHSGRIIIPSTACAEPDISSSPEASPPASARD